MLFADDDTDNVYDSDPEVLEEKIQREANRSTEWVEDNWMACAGDKTKLLIVETKMLRQSKLSNKSVSVNVYDNNIDSSHSEKLLGLIVNEELSWKDHLYGEKWRPEDNAPGLIPQLGQRVGLLYKLAPRLSKKGFNTISHGIFNSKLQYCLHVYGNVWMYNTMDENTRNFSAFTLQDCRKLQVLQNKVLRLKTGLDYDTPTSTLVSESNDLSVHQLIAYQTILTVHKTLRNKKPTYIYNLSLIHI